MSNWDQVKDGGKGSGMRSGYDHKKYSDNYAKIFGCKECKMKDGKHKMDCGQRWRER
jgi:hypothetical protein